MKDAEKEREGAEAGSAPRVIPGETAGPGTDTPTPVTEPEAIGPGEHYSATERLMAGLGVQGAGNSWTWPSR